MDRQYSERPHSHTSASKMASAASCNPRISSHVSTSTKNPSYLKVPQDSVHRDRRQHPATILLCKSQSSQAALVPKEHQMFMEEAYNAAICFKMFRDMSDSDPLHLKYIIKKIKNMARRSPNLVLETIHDYFTDNPEISNRHKFRLFRALESVIEATDFLEEIWKETFMQLALENMTKSTELEDGYQDAASDVLVAICRHSWRTVAQYLETELLTGVFPHRSLLYVMGVLTSDDGVLTQEDRAGWEEQVTQAGGVLLKWRLRGLRAVPRVTCVPHRPATQGPHYTRVLVCGGRRTVITECCLAEIAAAKPVIDRTIRQNPTQDGEDMNGTINRIDLIGVPFACKQDIHRDRPYAGLYIKFQ